LNHIPLTAFHGKTLAGQFPEDHPEDEEEAGDDQDGERDPEDGPAVDPPDEDQGAYEQHPAGEPVGILHTTFTSVSTASRNGEPSQSPTTMQSEISVWRALLM